MRPGTHKPWSVTWHLALVASFLLLGAFVVWEENPVHYMLAFVAAAAFLVGFVWLAFRVRVHTPFRDSERFKWLTATAVVLVTAGLFLPRAFYQWQRFENDSPVPEWAFQVGMGLAIVIAFALLMLAIWLAWATLIRHRHEPTVVETLSAATLGVGLWLLLLGAIIYRTDYTSEDILYFTLPYGLLVSIIGAVLLIVSDLWRRIHHNRVSSRKPDGTEVR